MHPYLNITEISTVYNLQNTLEDRVKPHQIAFTFMVQFVKQANVLVNPGFSHLIEPCVEEVWKPIVRVIKTALS